MAGLWMTSTTRADGKRLDLVACYVLGLALDIGIQWMVFRFRHMHDSAA
jgi:hypothetical protein